MNLERIKNYNQRLLAILGTIVLIIAVFGLIFISYFTIVEISRDVDYRQDEGVLSEEKVETLQEENKRLQVVSYGLPHLVDSLNLVYAIPVGHKTLNQPEDIDENINGLLNSYDSDSYKKKKYDGWYSSGNYGSYNNLILFDARTNKIKKLLDGRINFNQFYSKYFEDDIWLLFQAGEKDTNKDGIINLKDLNSLFLYSFKEKTLRTIQIKNGDVLGYKFIENTKHLIINYGIDSDQNGQYSAKKEPSFLKRYSFEKNQLDFIVDLETNKELQELLEGSTKE
jgi:hypothetical protein